MLSSLGSAAMQQFLARAEELGKNQKNFFAHLHPDLTFFQGFIGIMLMYLKKERKTKEKAHSVFERRHEPLCLCLFHLKYLFVHIDNEHLQLSAEEILP